MKTEGKSSFKKKLLHSVGVIVSFQMCHRLMVECKVQNAWNPEFRSLPADVLALWAGLCWLEIYN